MSYVVRLAADAKEDLRRAAQWYRDQDREIGEAWANGFEAAILGLAENPLRCGLAHESDAFPYEVRELLYGSGRKKTHRALFRIDGNFVHVLTIRHMAQRDVRPDDLG